MRTLLHLVSLLTLCTACTTEHDSELRSQTTAAMSTEITASAIEEKTEYVHAHGMPIKGRILMVASSPTVSEQTGWPIGFWASELTHPLHEFQEAGYEVDIASTEGGPLVMDSYSDLRLDH